MTFVVRLFSASGGPKKIFSVPDLQFLAALLVFPNNDEPTNGVDDTQDENKNESDFDERLIFGFGRNELVVTVSRAIRARTDRSIFLRKEDFLVLCHVHVWHKRECDST